MAYRLQDGLSFCQVDGRTIFLDTRNDRYFRLSKILDRAFHSYIHGVEISEAELGTLVEHNILAKTENAEISAPATHIDHPVFSAMEQPSRPRRPDVGILLEVLAIVGSTRLQLARCNLGRTLSAMSTYRDGRTSPPQDIRTKTEAQRLLLAAATFWSARPYVPIEPRCLLDSIAIVKFLARRGFHANLIFGVVSNPFSAHAWAQVANIVLTDSVGNVAAHTPIRAV